MTEVYSADRQSEAVTNPQMRDFTNRILFGAACKLGFADIDQDGEFENYKITFEHERSGDDRRRLYFGASKDDTDPIEYFYHLTMTDIIDMSSECDAPALREHIRTTLGDGDFEEYEPYLFEYYVDHELVYSPEEATEVELCGSLAMTHDYMINMPIDRSPGIFSKRFSIDLLDEGDDEVVSECAYNKGLKSEARLCELERLWTSGETIPDLEHHEGHLSEITIYDLSQMRQALICVGLVSIRSVLLSAAVRGSS